MMLKAATLLLACALIICQTHVSQAAPSRYARRSVLPVRKAQVTPCCVKQKCTFRTSKESVSDGVSLSSDEAQRFFNAVKELLQMPSDEQDHQTADADGYRMALNSSNDAPTWGMRYKRNTLLSQAPQPQLVCCFYQGIC